MINPPGSRQSGHLLRHLLTVTCLWMAAPLPVPAQDHHGELGDLSELRNQQFYIDKEARERPLDFLDVSDPIAPVNKGIYAFNRIFDTYVFLPVLRGYRFIVPVFVRKRIQSFWANIGEIPNIYNSLLQTGFRKAGRSAGRLVINTTIGLVGMFDPARRMGLERASEDLGQTLGYWGLGPGPYLVLPILGPSNLRDATGLVGDVFAEREINFLGVRKAESQFDRKGTAIFLIDAINRRDITDFRYGQTHSPFDYNIVRYLYTKQREIQIEE